MHINKKKKLVAGLSILSNVVLTVLKILAGVISGSLSIISEAIHSASDLLASIITFFSVIKSSEPADFDHPYGHGKYEEMAGLIEGILIILASFYIIYEAYKKIILGTIEESQNTLGIIVMFIAVISNFFVSNLLIKTSRQSNSISLYADGQHLRTDIYSSLGVLFGLILIKITGLNILDPVIAILIAMFIYKTGYNISRKSMMNLLDHAMPKEDIEKIKQIVENYVPFVNLKENSIKARSTGPTRDIDLILQFQCDTTICECHKICDEIEKSIREIYDNCSISIHPEPICYKKDCNESCDNCTCEENKSTLH